MPKKTRKQKAREKEIREVSRVVSGTGESARSYVSKLREGLVGKNLLSPELKRIQRKQGAKAQAELPFELDSKDKKTMAYYRTEDLFYSQGRNRYAGRGFKKSVRRAVERHSRIIKNAKSKQKHPENN